MADASTQTSLLKSIGALGGIRVTGDQTVNGNFMAIHALSDSSILSGTEGNIEGLIGSTISLGDVIVGEWTTIHINGDAILYKG